MKILINGSLIIRWLWTAVVCSVFYINAINKTLKPLYQAFIMFHLSSERLDCLSEWQIFFNRILSKNTSFHRTPQMGSQLSKKPLVKFTFRLFIWSTCVNGPLLWPHFNWSLFYPTYMRTYKFTFRLFIWSTCVNGSLLWPHFNWSLFYPTYMRTYKHISVIQKLFYIKPQPSWHWKHRFDLFLIFE